MRFRLPGVIAAVSVLAILAGPAARGESLASQRDAVAAALSAADRGRLDLATAARLQDHPLGGWLE
ncbi:MAG: hypothetical protein ACK52N_13550, partial [Lysobacteraceae bacterium]